MASKGGLVSRSRCGGRISTASGSERYCRSKSLAAAPLAVLTHSAGVRGAKLGQRFVARIAEDQGLDHPAELSALIRRRTPTPRISGRRIELKPPKRRQTLDRHREPHIAISALASSSRGSRGGRGDRGDQPVSEPVEDVEAASRFGVRPRAQGQVIERRQIRRTSFERERGAEPWGLYAVDVDPPVRDVKRAPENQPSRRGHHARMFDLVAAHRGQVLLHFDGAMMLPSAEANVEARQEKRRANGVRIARPRGPYHPYPERDRVKRVDDRDPIPRHTQVRERPEHLSPVTRERVEEAVRRVAYDRGERHFAFVILEPLHP